MELIPAAEWALVSDGGNQHTVLRLHIIWSFKRKIVPVTFCVLCPCVTFVACDVLCPRVSLIITSEDRE